MNQFLTSLRMQCVCTGVLGFHTFKLALCIHNKLRSHAEILSWWAFHVTFSGSNPLRSNRSGLNVSDGGSWNPKLTLKVNGLWIKMKGQSFASQVLSRHTFRISRKKGSDFFDHRGTLSFSARSWWLTESKALLKSIANIRTSLHLGSSRNLQILFWITSRPSVQLPPSLYANWLSSSCSSTGRWAWIVYTAFSRALATTGVTLIPRKSPLATGTSYFGNGLIQNWTFQFRLKSGKVPVPELLAQDSGNSGYFTSQCKLPFCNISNAKDCIWPHFQTQRREINGEAFSSELLRK